MIQYEYRDSVVRSGSPVLREVADRQYSFRSCFGYPEETAQYIETNGNTKGLSGKVVYCDMILIDVDEEGNVDAVKELVSNMGLGYSLWTTGNRGIHIHIPIDSVEGVNVPYSITEWLRGAGLWSLIDTTIYKAGSQFRVPEAIHDNTGLAKTLTKEVAGSTPTVPLLVPPPTVQRNDLVVDGDPYDFYSNLLQSRGEGGRHMHMFILWQAGRAAGLDRETVLEWIRWWNDNKAETPHTESMLAKKFGSFR